MTRRASARENRCRLAASAEDGRFGSESAFEEPLLKRGLFGLGFIVFEGDWPSLDM